MSTSLEDLVLASYKLQFVRLISIVIILVKLILSFVDAIVVAR